MKDNTDDNKNDELNTSDSNSGFNSSLNNDNNNDSLNNDSKENAYDSDTYGDYYSKIDEDPTNINFKKKPNEVAKGLFSFLKDTLSLKRGGIDVSGTVKEIQNSVEFSGYNVWVLMCSIVIASIGLNVNSTAVIIGAMLISPLMGPIRGIGLGIGTYDFKLLIRSLKNFGVATGISIFTSFVYFWVSPLDAETSELLGRTSPTFLDVLIAFFGGLAGIITAAKGMRSTVVPGVAIATALMPPLCTAGYGLAIANWTYFFGALYLFLLNSLFICLSTLLIIRYLKFPLREFISTKIEKKVKIYTSIFLIVIISPSGFLFYRLIDQSIFEGNAKVYTEKVIGTAHEDLRFTYITKYDNDPPIIEVNITPYHFSEEVIQSWRNQLANYSLDYAELKIIQGHDIESEMNELRKEIANSSGDKAELLLKEKENQLQSKDEKIDFYKNLYEKLKSQDINITNLAKRIKSAYPEIERLSVNKGLETNFNNKIDTVTTVMVRWNLLVMDVAAKNKAIGKTVQLELELENGIKTDSIRVINY